MDIRRYSSAFLAPMTRQEVGSAQERSSSAIIVRPDESKQAASKQRDFRKNLAWPPRMRRGIARDSKPEGLLPVVDLRGTRRSSIGPGHPRVPSRGVSRFIRSQGE